jgi:DNA repair protein RecO (recombination protein O)
VTRLAIEREAGPILRGFERRLLQELGYALALEREADTGAALDPERLYRYDPERGAVAATAAVAAEGLVVSGRVLLDIARDDYASPRTAQAAKQLMRIAIDHRLDRRPLHSRSIFKDLASL